MPNTIIESLYADPVSPTAGQMWFRPDLVAGFIPAAPSTGFSIAAGDTIITLTVGTVGGATSYNAYYTSNGTDPVIGGGATTKLTGVTNAQQITGLTNGTAYKLAFTSVGANGESALGTVLTATPTVGDATLFSQHFTSTVDFGTDAHLASTTSGSATITQSTTDPGTVTITSLTVADKAFVVLRDPVSKTADATFTALLKVTNFTSLGQTVAVLADCDTSPPVAGSTLAAKAFIGFDNTQFAIKLAYQDTSNVTQHWTGSAFSPTLSWAYTKGSSLTDIYYTLILETRSTPTAGFRMIVKSADGATTHATTEWVNWSDTVANSNNLFFLTGDQSGSNGTVTVIDLLSKA